MLKNSGLGTERRINLAIWEHAGGIGSQNIDQDIIILYDEPDTHLDYSYQRKLINIITEQCNQPNLKVIVATHSINLIDGVNIEDILNIKHDNNKRTIVDRLTSNSTSSEYLNMVSRSLGLRNTVLFHERLFVGVEGASEQNAFPLLFKVWDGKYPESYGITFWGCGSDHSALIFAKFLYENKREVYFVIDSDSRNSKGGVSEAKIFNYELPDDITYWIGNPNEFEDLFSDELWAEAANTLWPRVDNKEWKPDEIFKLRKGAKFSKDLNEMINVSSSKSIGKPEMTLELARFINDKSQIPPNLGKIFNELKAIAQKED
jgi:predicted ATP-dependent endonuclease of OLD family